MKQNFLAFTGLQNSISDMTNSSSFNWEHLNVRAEQYEDFYSEHMSELFTEEGLNQDDDDGEISMSQDLFDFSDRPTDNITQIDPTAEAWMLNEFYASKIQIESFKEYLDKNWDLVEVDLTSRLAKQRKNYWDGFVRLYTNDLMRNYYADDMYKYVDDYRKYVRIRQKLHAFRYKIEAYREILESVFFSNYQPNIKHKVQEFDMLNLLRRHIKFNSIAEAPSFEKVSGADSSEWDPEESESDLSLWNWSFNNIKNWAKAYRREEQNQLTKGTTSLKNKIAVLRAYTENKNNKQPKLTSENYDIDKNKKIFEIDTETGLNFENKQITKDLQLIINKDKTLETFFENRLEYADEDQMWVEDIYEDTPGAGFDLVFGTQRDFINTYIRERSSTLGWLKKYKQKKEEELGKSLFKKTPKNLFLKESYMSFADGVIGDLEDWESIEEDFDTLEMGVDYEIDDIWEVNHNDFDIENTQTEEVGEDGESDNMRGDEEYWKENLTFDDDTTNEYYESEDPDDLFEVEEEDQVEWLDMEDQRYTSEMEEMDIFAETDLEFVRDKLIQYLEDDDDAIIDLYNKENRDAKDIAKRIENLFKNKKVNNIYNLTGLNNITKKNKLNEVDFGSIEDVQFKHIGQKKQKMYKKRKVISGLLGGRKKLGLQNLKNINKELENNNISPEKKDSLFSRIGGLHYLGVKPIVKKTSTVDTSELDSVYEIKKFKLRNLIGDLSRGIGKRNRELGGENISVNFKNIAENVPIADGVIRGPGFRNKKKIQE